jgi:hypothetical protein
MIKPDTKIYVDGIKSTWKESLDARPTKWKVNYKAGDEILKKKYESFNSFWLVAGEEYCKKNNLKYISKNDDLDE